MLLARALAAQRDEHAARAVPALDLPVKSSANVPLGTRTAGAAAAGAAGGKRRGRPGEEQPAEHGAGGEAARREVGEVLAQPQGEGAEHGGDGAELDREQPRRVPVGAAAEPVQGGEEPDGEVEVVRAAPAPCRAAGAAACS